MKSTTRAPAVIDEMSGSADTESPPRGELARAAAVSGIARRGLWLPGPVHGGILGADVVNVLLLLL